MLKIQRLAAVGALSALTVALGACSNAEEASNTVESAASGATGAAGEAAGDASSEMMSPSSEMMMESSEMMAPGGMGVTTTADIFGPACNQVPTSGEGSAEGMVDDPVGTAASNNPLLTTLVAAVTAANLGDTLNSAEALTVFAPFNGAFEALPPGTVETLTTAPDAAQPTSQLSQILTYHVVGERMDAEGIVSAGSLPSLQGGEITVTGTPDAPVVNGATVLCGNIPTANATVFVIDQVLMPTP